MNIILIYRIAFHIVSLNLFLWKLNGTFCIFVFSFLYFNSCPGRKQIGVSFRASLKAWWVLALLLRGGPEVSQDAFCSVSASSILPLLLSAPASQPSLSQQKFHSGTKRQQRPPGCLLWAYLLPRIMASRAPVALGALQHLQERYKKFLTNHFKMQF